MNPTLRRRYPEDRVADEHRPSFSRSHVHTDITYTQATSCISLVYLAVVTNLFVSPYDRIEKEGFTYEVMRLICSGSARGFVRAISLRLEQVFHDVGDNSIFAVLRKGLTVRNVDADPVFDLCTLESHLEKGK